MVSQQTHAGGRETDEVRPIIGTLVQRRVHGDALGREQRKSGIGLFGCLVWLLGLSPRPHRRLRLAGCLVTFTLMVTSPMASASTAAAGCRESWQVGRGVNEAGLFKAENLYLKAYYQ